MPKISWTELSNVERTYCMEYYSKKDSANQTSSSSKFPLYLNYTDITGPIDPASLGGDKCALVFLEGHTSIETVYFLQQWSEFHKALVAYRELTDKEQGRMVYRLRLDRSGGNTSRHLGFCYKEWVLVQYALNHASYSNEAAERLMKELWKVGWTMLLSSRLPVNLRHEAISYANWLRNKFPST